MAEMTLPICYLFSQTPDDDARLLVYMHQGRFSARTWALQTPTSWPYQLAFASCNCPQLRSSTMAPHCWRLQACESSASHFLLVLHDISQFHETYQHAVTWHVPNVCVMICKIFSWCWHLCLSPLLLKNPVLPYEAAS